jgi:tetratricopeptide (TPR) repeat protein
MAVDIYERALSSSAQAGARSELHYMIGKMRNALGQRDVAVAHLRHSIFNLQSADWPTVGPNAYNQLGLDLLLMDLSDEAIIAFAKTLAVKPDNRDAHIGLGRAFYQIGDFASAINAYSAARQAGTTCIVEFNMGLAHLGLGDTTRAMEIYTQAIDSCGGRHGPIGQAVADLQKLRATGVATEAVTTIIEMLDGNQP